MDSEQLAANEEKLFRMIEKACDSEYEELTPLLDALRPHLAGDAEGLAMLDRIDDRVTEIVGEVVGEALTGGEFPLVVLAPLEALPF